MATDLQIQDTKLAHTLHVDLLLVFVFVICFSALHPLIVSSVFFVWLLTVFEFSACLVGPEICLMDRVLFLST